ncbi:AmmeMemoRadiSam system protein A [Desulforhopalus sp. IMCC35007]|uniref:AmmeMemoRadiSam system protein A n=1 Tax=Desulforhopalus sp. IMCC35007 TaxID=2569543 RepID=UPI0010AE5C1C|nr:AmmeMemoRadiSam system protein A [Desulforhopalus sp. IMCC35007]TKB11657.1 AmmeMemoRadiSam system protein A [Desulforhopalus sp. IMCC35007]
MVNKTHLTNEQGAVLLRLARETLVHKFSGGSPVAVPNDPDLLQQRAVFVTLTLAGKLRGCIGNLVPVGPLWQGVSDNALHAAFDDQRFSPLTVKELGQVKIEVSVLTPAVELRHTGGADLLEKLRPGIDGVILKKGRQSATFLPQVWEQLTDPSLFLAHLCLKAGLPKECWITDEISIETYQVESFSEEKL